MKERQMSTTEALVNNPMVVQGAKIGGIWAMVGISTWSDLAGFLAAVLSFLALCEYLWKKLIRPLLVHFGKLKPIKQKVIEVVEE